MGNSQLTQESIDEFFQTLPSKYFKGYLGVESLEERGLFTFYEPTNSNSFYNTEKKDDKKNDGKTIEEILGEVNIDA